MKLICLLLVSLVGIALATDDQPLLTSAQDNIGEGFCIHDPCHNYHCRGYPGYTCIANRTTCTRQWYSSAALPVKCENETMKNPCKRIYCPAVVCDNGTQFPNDGCCDSCCDEASTLNCLSSPVCDGYICGDNKNLKCKINNCGSCKRVWVDSKGRPTPCFNEVDTTRPPPGNIVSSLSLSDLFPSSLFPSFSDFFPSSVFPSSLFPSSFSDLFPSFSDLFPSSLSLSVTSTGLSTPDLTATYQSSLSSQHSSSDSSCSSYESSEDEQSTNSSDSSTSNSYTWNFSSLFGSIFPPGFFSSSTSSRSSDEDSSKHHHSKWSNKHGSSDHSRSRHDSRRDSSWGHHHSKSKSRWSRPDSPDSNGEGLNPAV